MPERSAAILPALTRWREWPSGFSRHGSVPLTVLGFILIGTALGPWIWPIDFAFADFSASAQGPSAAHPLGTDVLGRDLLARLMLGTQVSLLIAVSSQLVAVALGTVLGLLAGTGRRWADGIVMRSIDIVLAVPDVLLVILLVPLFSASLGTSAEPGILASLNEATSGALGLALAITATSWMLTARLVRAEVLSLRESEFYRAAIVTGASRLRLMTVHLLPNVAPVALTALSLGIPRAILLESGISYLGLGLMPPTPTIGLLIADGVEAMRSEPTALVFPALLLCALVISINSLGDAVRNYIDKREPGR